MNRLIYIVIGLLLVGILLGGLWFFLFRGGPATDPTTPGDPFGTGTFQTVEVTPITQENTPATGTGGAEELQQKIFRVVNGPIIGVTVVQISQPTTTLARYVQQHNGHVFDLMLDSPGAVPKAVSNTTIPGITRALWTKQGQGVVLQYLDSNVVKTVSLSFPPQNATTTQPVGIKFLPDGIYDIAVSPNGMNVTYLLRTQTGVRGYIAATDGSGSREVFTLQLSEVVVTWPSANTLLVHTKSAYGVPGIAFSVTVSSGAVIPLLHANGITLTANPSYSYLVYQTHGTDGEVSTYSRTLKTGANNRLSFDPYPERCIWGTNATSTLYCATPIEDAPVNYLDLWHAGTATTPEALIRFTFPDGKSSLLAVPGSDEGGRDSTIDTISVSPDEKYLLFVRRGDRSLWGVRL